MKLKDTYKLKFTGLSNGLHDFDWTMDRSFFDEQPPQGIDAAALHAQVMLDKKNNLMSLKINIVGSVTVQCDRCTNPVILPIDCKSDLVVRFAESTDLSGDEVIFLSPAEHAIELKQLFYELVITHLPLKRAHAAEECDQKIIEYLNEKSSKSADPRWTALESLKFKE
ncbi:MAG: hypothetical protein Kow0075_00040 [Salibacteraceae bacterium]